MIELYVTKELFPQLPPPPNPKSLDPSLMLRPFLWYYLRLWETTIIPRPVRDHLMSRLQSPSCPDCSHPHVQTEVTLMSRLKSPSCPDCSHPHVQTAVTLMSKPKSPLCQDHPDILQQIFLRPYSSAFSSHKRGPPLWPAHSRQLQGDPEKRPPTKMLITSTCFQRITFIFGAH